MIEGSTFYVLYITTYLKTTASELHTMEPCQKKSLSRSKICFFIPYNRIIQTLLKQHIQRMTIMKSPHLSISSCEWANVQLAPRGHCPRCERSRHMFVLYFPFCRLIGGSTLLPVEPRCCVNSTRPWSTTWTALTTTSRVSQPGALGSTQ